MPAFERKIQADGQGRMTYDECIPATDIARSSTLTLTEERNHDPQRTTQRRPSQ
jgi:hypothetical protein